MIQTIEGRTQAADLRWAIVASRFNQAVADELLGGAIDCLLSHGAQEPDLLVIRVPGAFEIPMTVSKVLRSEKLDGVITTGALIRGETPHFDFIARQVTAELSSIAVESGVPVSFGILTCDTLEQARDRSRPGNNKGWEAALAAIEMADLYRAIQGRT
ncbi:MAG TPA: 6,7-dimethyl-8-ribityllumazine synthase [Thermoanaerobaculia bacterium]|nr:6,7-dimethyl-8-ribityllumazine synthase [Thermoanaerobaculia bacterium]